ncbi:peptidoglycan-binding protein [Hyphomonas sp.]|uniref:peptidoglycan-binding protein n=1 Tax=Hyphomonas sp. TaxID=87 RepID=UPI001D35F9A3|nr:peptidoglycan-binding protein [Hyphomonas sp.]MBU4063309.1 SEL1-like repeat protein [Alphaproteobacteria bacterium]MBU4164127.1 SEL1-like repeat protein [Alphaproteobacteria bacterium]
MSQTGQWNKFSNDRRAREAAREAAMAEGITLGEYLNRLLTMVEEPQPSETPYSYSRRTGAPSQQSLHPQPPQQDSATTLDRLARRIEATEARSTLAINGIDHTVLGLVARLENAEQTTVAVAGHVEGLIDEMRATHEALQSKVRRLESDDSGQGNIEALRALEGALGKLATHVYEEGELTQNETAAIKGRIESGFADLTDRVEGIETRVDRTLSDAAARVERAVEQAELRAEGTARGLAERMSTLEEKLSQAAPSEERLSAVEADVSGALDSMESTLLRIQERLNRAETSTDSALKSLESTFAHLDERIEAVASQIDPEQAERLKQEFEQRFEDLTRSVRSAVDNARLELANEITAAAAGQDEKLEERLKAEVSELRARLAEVEAREPTDLTATVQEEIGRLGANVAERIDALAAHVEDRLEESEMRSAEAIEQVGEQVTVAAVRLQKRQDEAITALAQDLDGMRKASDARLSDALSGVSERLEQIQSQSSESLSPVQRAIVALATRLESLEAFTTPPHVPVPPPVLQPDFAAPAAGVHTPAAPAKQEPAPIFEAAEQSQTEAGPEPEINLEADFEAGFSGWDVVDTPKVESPYQSDFDQLREAALRMTQDNAEPESAPEVHAHADAAGTHNYIADIPADDFADDDARGFDPISELDAFNDLDDSLEGSHTETRESDIFDDEPDFARTLADTLPGAPSNAAEDEETADYLARARRAALAAASNTSRTKPRAAPLPRTATEKASGGSRLPLYLAASAVAITGAGVGGFLYLRGKQPVTPALSGPVDTYVDPETGVPTATTVTAAAERPVPADAEQMLFEDETALVAADLFEAAEVAETASPDGPASDILALAESAAAEAPPAVAEPIPVIASVRPAPPEAKPASRMPPKPEIKPAVQLTPEQAAIKSIVTAAEAIEAAEPPSIKPDLATLAPQPAAEPVRLATRGDTSFPAIPVVVTVEAEANAGNAVAQYQYAQVKLTEGDLETAAAFLRRAAQKGIAPAQYELGKLYERGQGVDRDIIEARNLIQKAAEAGHIIAMYDYALFLAEGEGGEKSEIGAVDWFTQAAELGVIDAQYNLGVINAEGIGVPKDLVRALYWFEVAAKAGDTGAEQEVANLRTRLSMSDAMDAREQADAWKASAPNALANGRFGAQRWNTGNPLQVQAVQTALGRLGFGAGTPDGVLGPKTADAIRDYQGMEGLEITGTITPQLVDHLNARAAGSRRS